VKVVEGGGTGRYENGLADDLQGREGHPRVGPGPEPVDHRRDHPRADARAHRGAPQGSHQGRQGPGRGFEGRRAQPAPRSQRARQEAAQGQGDHRGRRASPGGRHPEADRSHHRGDRQARAGQGSRDPRGLKRAVNPPVSTFGTSTRDPNVPRHVAIVMDGNGRWAKKRFMPRIFGHKHGVDALVSTINACANRGVEHLTVFAFSSENWKRPEEEVSGLMGLVLSAMTRYLTKIAGDGVRVRIIGDRDAVSQTVRNAWERAETTTAHNTRITVWVAFNYGGRWDIVQACQRAIRTACRPALTEETLSRYMAQREAPDPDLFIRTGGEVRISNFLLWQVAYSELHFTECLWPDFDETELDRAFKVYATRDRRFGGVKPEAAVLAGSPDAA
jgi:undecaprenyl diphosphate synthase